MRLPFRIIESWLMFDEIDHGPLMPHPRKRIAKKWLKRYGRDIERKPMSEFFVSGDTVFCHPDMARAIREELQHQSVIKRLEDERGE